MKNKKFEIKNLLRDKQGKFANALTQKNIKLAKITLLVLSFVFLVGLFFNLTKKTVNWFRHNTIVFKSPVTIVFNKPVTFISFDELSVLEAKNNAIEEISQNAVNQYLNPNSLPKCTNSVDQINPTVFFNDIRKKESSNGKNDNPVALHNYCANKGKWNEIGYNPQSKFCFKDQEEAQLYVAYYIKKNCSNLTMSQCLCFWNTGKVLSSCAYSENRLSFAN